MKNPINLSLVSIFMICTLFVYSQEKCKVLVPSLSGTYEGKCKNGLANGKGTAVGTDRYEGQFRKGLPEGNGTYTWSDGRTYKGDWIEGMRHGIGKYTMQINGKDSIQDGLWQNDIYKGPKPPKPNVTYNSGVERYDFNKTLSPSNRVLVDIYLNGTRNRTVTNLMMSASSGNNINYDSSVGYENIVFPVTIKIEYSTMNKLNTLQYNVKFDFVISEPGDWKVSLYN